MPDDVWLRAEKIDGWLTRPEAELLWKYAAKPWCELGSWRGRSTVVLGSRCHGYAVDWFKGSPEHGGVDTYSEFMQNIKRLPVHVIHGRLEQKHGMVPDGLRLLFLDADHSYQSTSQAFDLYSPKLGRNGVLILHDALPFENHEWPGVRLFYKQLLDRHDWRPIAQADRSAAFRKL